MHTAFLVGCSNLLPLTVQCFSFLSSPLLSFPFLTGQLSSLSPSWSSPESARLSQTNSLNLLLHLSALPPTHPTTISTAFSRLLCITSPAVTGRCSHLLYSPLMTSTLIPSHQTYRVRLRSSQMVSSQLLSFPFRCTIARADHLPRLHYSLGLFFPPQMPPAVEQPRQRKGVSGQQDQVATSNQTLRFLAGGTRHPWMSDEPSSARPPPPPASQSTNGVINQKSQVVSCDKACKDLAIEVPAPGAFGLVHATQTATSLPTPVEAHADHDPQRYVLLPIYCIAFRPPCAGVLTDFNH